MTNSDISFENLVENFLRELHLAFNNWYRENLLTPEKIRQEYLRNVAGEIGVDFFDRFDLQIFPTRLLFMGYN